MSKRPRCDAPECTEPKFYVNGAYCLGHLKNPPPHSKRQSDRRPEPPAVVEESESSD